MEIKDFELPQDGNFTEDEVKGLKALGSYIKAQLETVAAGIASVKDVTASVKAEFEKAGISGAKLDKLEAALKAQGATLSLMKETRTGQGGDTLAAQVKAFVEDKANIEAIRKGQAAGVELQIKGDAELMTTTNAKPAINLFNVEIDRTIHEAPREADAIYSRLVKGATASPTISWVNRKDKDGGAAFIDEGALKPLKDWQYETETSTVKKVAVSCKVSTEMLTDAPFMRGEIERLLRQDLMSVVNEKVLTGTGTGAEIKGVTQDAAGYTSSDLDDKIENPNYADAVRAAVLQLRMLNYRPDTLFINPVDNAVIDLTKDTTGHYLATEMRALVSGITIVETANIAKGKFLLMDTSRWMLRPYENLRLEYGLENDDFRKNLVTVIAEMRLHSYQNSIDKGSLVYADFATVLAALEKTASAAV